MKDWRGNDYEVGSTVLYPRMSGRSCEMQEGTVLEIKHYEEKNYWRSEPEITPRYKVKIMPTKSSRDFYRSGYNWSADTEEIKPVWITIESNVTAVTDG